MTADHFCLKWNNYPLNMVTELDSLRTSEDLVDVTLSCDGQLFKAHKVVLSMCSSYFRNVFKVNENTLYLSNTALRFSICFFFFFTLSAHTPISLYLYRAIGRMTWAFWPEVLVYIILYTSRTIRNTQCATHHAHEPKRHWCIFVSVSVWYESSHTQQYIDVLRFK